MTRASSRTITLPRLPRRLVRDVATRSLILWVAVRCCYLAVALFLAPQVPGAEPLALLGGGPAAVVIFFAAVLVRFDVRVCRETLLLANLGVPAFWIQLGAASVSTSLEVALNVIAAAAGA